MASGQGFHAKPSPTLRSLPAGLKQLSFKVFFFIDQLQHAGPAANCHAKYIIAGTATAITIRAILL